MKPGPPSVSSPIAFAALAGILVTGISGSFASGGACLILLAVGGIGLARLGELRRRMQSLIPPDEVKQSIGDALLVAAGYRRDDR